MHLIESGAPDSSHLPLQRRHDFGRKFATQCAETDFGGAIGDVAEHRTLLLRARWRLLDSMALRSEVAAAPDVAAAEAAAALAAAAEVAAALQ